MIEGTERGALADANGRFLFLNVQGTEVGLGVLMLGYRELRMAVRVGTPGSGSSWRSRPSPWTSWS
jgi:hypothetical protein